MEGVPERALTSELQRAPAQGNDAVRRCLYVHNHTSHTAAIFADGRHAGYLGPHSSAAYFVGRSVGAKTLLRATCREGAWESEVSGPVWDLVWHLR